MAAAERAGLRWRTAWIVLWGIGGLLAVALSLGPAAPDASPRFLHADKLDHALAYAALAWWGVGCFGSARGRGGALLAVFLLGAGLELAQAAWTTDRHGDAFDVLANAVGVACGAMLGRWISLPRWGEACLRRRRT